MRYSAVPRVAIYKQPTWQRYDVLDVWLCITDIDIDLSRFFVDGCFRILGFARPDTFGKWILFDSCRDIVLLTICRR